MYSFAGKILMILALLTVPAVSYAQNSVTWGILPGDAVNVHADFVNVTTVLLEQHLSEQGINVVRGEPGSEASALFAQGAVFVVRFSIVRMGETVKISVQKIGTDGKALISTSMTAGSPDDLDAVTNRLARFLVTGAQPEEGESIYEVTEREQDALKKKRSTMYYGLKIVGATGLTSELNQGALKYGGGIYALYDPRSFLAEIYTNFIGGSSGDFTEFSWELGVSGFYPLTNTNLCPYVGGGVSISSHTADWSEQDSNTWGGLTVNVAAGVIFGRTSDIILRAEVKFFADTYDVSDEFSSGLMYSLSIGF